MWTLTIGGHEDVTTHPTFVAAEAAARCAIDPRGEYRDADLSEAGTPYFIQFERRSTIFPCLSH